MSDFGKIGRFSYSYLGEVKTLNEWIIHFNAKISPRRLYRRLNNKNWQKFELAFREEYVRGYAEDYIGKTVNKINILECVGKNKGDIVVKCKCFCGNIFDADWSPIFKNNTKSCGCLKNRIGKNNPKFKGFGEVSQSIIACLRNGAEERGLEFDVNAEYLWNLFIKQDKKCAITKLQLILPQRRTDTKYNASLDRIDSSKGYIEGNVQWVHRNINTMKWDFTQEEFIKYCKLVAQNT